MIDDALPPNSTFDGDKRDCPRTTPEARAELRRTPSRTGWLVTIRRSELHALLDDADALAGALAEVARLRAALERLRSAAQFGIEGMDTAEVLDAIVADADGELAPESKGAEQ